jgi:hypothetical protein
LESFAPSTLLMLQSSEGLARLQAEEVLVIDLPGRLKGRPKAELSS